MPGNAAIDEVAGLGKITGDPKVREFAQRLCSRIETANVDGENIVKNIEDQMLAFTGLTRKIPNYRDRLVEFYNKNHHDFICKGKVTGTTRESEHLMKRALALKIQGYIFDDFFFDTEDVDVNVNAIEYVDGKPETVLDYLDKILLSPNASRRYVISDIKDLKEALIEQYGAKHAKELI